MQKIVYGTKDLSGNFTGVRVGDLPYKLETVYEELDIPSNVEFVVDGRTVENDAVVLENDNIIEIRAVAGKKGKQ